MRRMQSVGDVRRLRQDVDPRIAGTHRDGGLDIGLELDAMICTQRHVRGQRQRRDAADVDRDTVAEPHRVDARWLRRAGDQDRGAVVALDPVEIDEHAAAGAAHPERNASGQAEAFPVDRAVADDLPDRRVRRCRRPGRAAVLRLVEHAGIHPLPAGKDTSGRASPWLRRAELDAAGPNAVAAVPGIAVGGDVAPRHRAIIDSGARPSRSGGTTGAGGGRRVDPIRPGPACPDGHGFAGRPGRRAQRGEAERVGVPHVDEIRGATTIGQSRHGVLVRPA